MTQSEGSPVTPVNSNSSSVSDPFAAPWPSEELDSGTNHAYYAGENKILGQLTVILCVYCNLFPS